MIALFFGKETVVATGPCGQTNQLIANNDSAVHMVTSNPRLIQGA